MNPAEGETTPTPGPPRPKIREYPTDEIIVRWEPRFCIHSGHCTASLPGVFDRDARPWIVPTNADTDELVRVISSCPTGALHFERLDGGAQEEPPTTITVEPQPDGPLYVRGRMQIIGAEGEIIREDTRVALCRCGASRHKPFCDGSHEEAGFISGD